ncbi:MAG TPA: hypothetical protein VK497_02150 [Candidatus Saccharimonadales bacterium]|nr:hypothetical protein [Candidatus Saccharimonadales bacterium]
MLTDPKNRQYQNILSFARPSNDDRMGKVFKILSNLLLCLAGVLFIYGKSSQEHFLTHQTESGIVLGLTAFCFLEAFVLFIVVFIRMTGSQLNHTYSNKRRAFNIVSLWFLLLATLGVAVFVITSILKLYSNQQ